MKKLALLLTAALILAVASVVGVSQDDKTVLLFLCEDIKGDAVEDLSGNGNNGTISGNIKIVKGKWNNGYEFDGKSHIKVPSSDTLNIRQNITYEAWAKRTEGPDNDLIFDKRAGDGGFELMLWKGGNFAAYAMIDTVGDQTDMHTGKAVPVGEWHHYALTYDGEKMKLYVDANVAVEKDRAGDLGITSDLFIGAENGTGGFFNGVLDNLRISNVARTKNEIKDAYERGFVTAVNASGKLTALWGAIKKAR